MATDWKVLKDKFQELLDHCTQDGGELSQDVLRPAFTEVGKGAFDLIHNSKLRISIDDCFKEKPVVKCMRDIHGVFRDIEYYDDYWLCVLGFLGRGSHVLIRNERLLESRIPLTEGEADWEARFRSEEVRDRFSSGSDIKYLSELCRVSIKACEYIFNHSDIESSLSVDELNHSIKYNDRTILFPGSSYWDLFLLIYNKNGDPATIEEIKELNDRGRINVLIGELKGHLKKIGGAEGAKIANAIENQRSVGYRFNSSKL